MSPSRPDIEARSLSGVCLEVAAAAMARAYEGYFVRIGVDAAQLARRMRSEHIEPAPSLVYFAAEAPVGVLFIARRGRTARVAAFGLAPEARGLGVGRALLTAAIGAARARGDERLVLEVITENTPAVRLYESLGFARTRKLVGYERDAGSPTASQNDALLGGSAAAAAELLGRWSDPNLPWQLAPPSFADATPPLQGYTLDGRAVALVDGSAKASIRLASLAVDPAYRGQGFGRRLIEGLCASHPDRPWSIPAVVPEGLGERLLTAAGWRLASLSQWEMQRDLG